MPYKNKNSSIVKKPTLGKKPLLITVAVILVAAAAFGGYWKFGHKNTAHTDTTANAETKGEPDGTVSTQSNTTTPSSSSTPAPSSSSSTDKTSPTSGTETQNVNLLTPTGSFVSNHRPNLSGSPAPNTMQSSCTTTPGVQCQISFTNKSDGTVKTLEAKTTDSGGAAYWNYTLQSAGLTVGDWTVKATATSGSQSKSASDAMALVVQQ